jgi:hypothetical protein
MWCVNKFVEICCGMGSDRHGWEAIAMQMLRYENPRIGVIAPLELEIGGDLVVARFSKILFWGS